MRRLFILISATIVTSVLMAQDIAVPEFKNEPMPIKSDGTLQRLEFTHYESGEHSDDRSNTVAFMPTSQQDYITYDYPKSPVRLNTSVEFMIKLSDPEIDPESQFLLTRVVETKTERTVYSSGKSSYGPSMKVNLEFKKIGPGLYKIIPEKLVANTEYAFVYIPDSGSKTKCYLFGTD